MTWARNPFFRVPAAMADAAESGGSPEADAEAEARLPQRQPSEAEAASLTAIRRPTSSLTGHQLFYIFVLDGLGAMVLSGGINFAIAYAMYVLQDTEKHPIRLFQLPNTLAGDGAVTIIVQCIITWMVELVLVNRDIGSGHVAPIGFLSQPSNKLARWFLFLDRDQSRASGTTLGDHPNDGSFVHWAFFLYSQLLRGFLTSVPSFVLMWGPSVGILTAVGTRSGGDWDFHKTWAPQVFKLLLGGILALVTTPLFALFWLVRAGWALQTNAAAADVVTAEA